MASDFTAILEKFNGRRLAITDARYPLRAPWMKPTAAGQNKWARRAAAENYERA